MDEMVQWGGEEDTLSWGLCAYWGVGHLFGGGHLLNYLPG